MRTLRFLLRKELLQIRRDPVILRMIFLMPIIQLVLLASAATFEVKRARMYVVDLDRSETSRGVIDRLTASGRFVHTGATASMSVASEAMLARETDLIVSIAAGFERDLVRNRAAQLQLVLNAEDGATAGVTQAYAVQIIQSFAAELGVELRPAFASPAPADARAPRPGQPRLEVSSRGWYNPELDYKDYMIPGILVQLVTIVGTVLTAINIVREKEIGTLDQLNVTPVSRGTFIAAKLLPMWAIALVELGLGLVVARMIFDVPMEGSLALVFLGAIIYLLAALGLGLFISTIVETQQQAMFVAFFIMMIYLLMSGLFTPVRSMPEWAQWIAEFNPVKHFIEMMRAVLLKGAGLADVARTLGILAAFGAGFVTLALRSYGKRTA